MFLSTSSGNKFYFCMSTDTSLRQMPVLSADYEAKAEATSGRLRGDPSLPLDDEPEEDPAAEQDEDGEARSITSRGVQR